jgi:hypothetical protein
MTSQSVPLSDLARGPAVKFDAIGDKVIGRIISARREQQRDFESGQPMTWANGDPRLQTVITLDTADGEQTLYARGGRYDVIAEGTGLSMEAAIVTAVSNAGGPRSIDPGAELVVQHTGLAKASKAGLNGAKLYTAAYRPPSPAEAEQAKVSDLFNDEPF